MKINIQATVVQRQQEMAGTLHAGEIIAILINSKT